MSVQAESHASERSAWLLRLGGRGAGQGRGGMALALLVSLVPSLYQAWLSNSVTADSYAANTSDALVFRMAAELLSRGESPYDTRRQAQYVAETRLDGRTPAYTLPFAYPPNALPLFMIYLAGPPRVAFLLFVTAGTLAALLAARSLGATLGWPAAGRAALLPALGIGGGLIFNAMLGQTGGLLAAAVFAYAAFYDRRPGWAGVMLGLMAFKPQYALPFGVVALMGRRWGIIATAMATFAACTLVSGAAFGFDLWGDFAAAIRGHNHTISHMCNWYALCNVFNAGAAAEGVGIEVMLLGAALLALACRMQSGGSDDGDREGETLAQLSLAAVVALLVSPNTHPYDLTLLMLPILCAAPGRRWGVAVVLAGVAGMAILYLLVFRWALTLMVAGAGVWLLAQRFGGARGRLPAVACNGQPAG